MGRGGGVWGISVVLPAVYVPAVHLPPVHLLAAMPRSYGQSWVATVYAVCLRSGVCPIRAVLTIAVLVASDCAAESSAPRGLSATGRPVLGGLLGLCAPRASWQYWRVSGLPRGGSDRLVDPFWRVHRLCH